MAGEDDKRRDEAATGHQEDRAEDMSREGTPPPLPPRRRIEVGVAGSLRLRPSPSRPGTSSSTRPTLQGKATTALSLADIHVQSHGRDEIASTSSRQVGVRFGRSRSASDGSIMSFAPTLETGGGEMESMLGEVLQDATTPGLKRVPLREEEGLFPVDEGFDDAFEREFDELDDITSDGFNTGQNYYNHWGSRAVY